MSKSLLKLLIFIAFTYLITLPYDTLLLRHVYGHELQIVLGVFLTLRNYIPLVATVITLITIGDSVRSGLSSYGVRGCRFRYIIICGLIPFAIYGIGVAYALLMGFNVVNPLIPLYSEYGRELPEGGESFVLTLSLLSTLFVGSTIIAFVMLGQEVGWRGIMLVELTNLIKRGAIVNIIIGTVWGLWYAPLILLYGYYYSGHRNVVGVSMIILAFILLSNLLARVRLRFNSVLASSAVLGVLSGLHNLMAYTIIAVDEIYSIPYGLLGIASIATLLTIMNLIRYRGSIQPTM